MMKIFHIHSNHPPLKSPIKNALSKAINYKIKKTLARICCTVFDIFVMTMTMTMMDVMIIMIMMVMMMMMMM